MSKSQFQRPDGTPLPENSCLEYRKDRKSYRMRVTVDRGPKFSGERIVIPLATSNEETARAMRDTILDALNRAGVLARKIVPAGDKIQDGESESDS